MGKLATIPQWKGYSSPTGKDLNIFRCLERRLWAHLGSLEIRGRWFWEKKRLHINVLEMKATFLALQVCNSVQDGC